MVGNGDGIIPVLAVEEHRLLGRGAPVRAHGVYMKRHLIVGAPVCIADHKRPPFLLFSHYTAPRQEMQEQKEKSPQTGAFLIKGCSTYQIQRGAGSWQAPGTRRAWF